LDWFKTESGGENPNGDKLEWLNEFDSEFGSGLSPNASVKCLTGWVRAERRGRPIGWLGRPAGGWAAAGPLTG
jgi:hypothetical protein